MHRVLIFEIEYEDDGYCVISDNVTLMYGDGDTLLLAIGDYLMVLVEYVRFVIGDFMNEIARHL